jgi:hypothetical protein
MSNRTETLLGAVLGEPLADYVKRHREDDRSWQWIADKLSDATGTRYSRELLRRWYATKADSEHVA